MARKFNAPELRDYARKFKNSYEFSNTILEKSYKNFNHNKVYDVFLSHSYRDAEVIHGLKLFLENLGLSVYVDWVEDRQMDRSKVSKETAGTIKSRMKNCKSLLLASSESTPNSKWVPWEVGYFDGIKSGRIAVLPISDSYTSSEEYEGQEYLGLYSYAVFDKRNSDKKETIFVQSSPTIYVDIQQWVNGKEPFERGA